MAVTFSIVVPTLGRDTLAATLDSVYSQTGPGDQVVLAIDAYKANGAAAAAEFNARRRPQDQALNVPCDGTGPGYNQRNVAIKAACGTHLLFMDDDDVYLPGALDLFRAAACDRPVIFRMDSPILGVVWRDEWQPRFQFGNVGTPMFCVPNQPARLGVWAPYTDYPSGGDWVFVAGCAANMGEPIWREEIVASIGVTPNTFHDVRR